MSSTNCETHPEKKVKTTSKTKSMNNLLPVGATLNDGKYRIDKYLASGGFGNTYLAYDCNFNMPVAIKEFFIAGVNDRQAVTRSVSVSNAVNQPIFDRMRSQFRKEAIRLRKLHSQHIVRVQDLFDENGTSYYVMDFIDGTALAAHMKQTGKPFDEAAVMDILPQVVDALDEIHHQGIWHLDIKPANIMRDGSGNVIIIDFGASKQLTQDEKKTTTTTQLSYTPGYAAPELLEGNTNRLGPWTDFYALGATLYNLLTGNTPPQASDLTEEGEKAFAFPPGVSSGMRKLIGWLMSPTIKGRPLSLDDIRTFLTQNLSKNPDIVKPIGPHHDTRKDGNDEQRRSADSEATIHAGSDHQNPADTKPKQAGETEKERKKKKQTIVIISVLFAIAAAIFIAVLSVRGCGKKVTSYYDEYPWGQAVQPIEAADMAEAVEEGDQVVEPADEPGPAYLELPETMSCAGYLSDGSRQWPITVDLHYVSYTQEVWGTYHNKGTSIDLDGSYDGEQVKLESYKGGEQLRLVLNVDPLKRTFNGTAYGQYTLQCHLSY